MDLNTLREYVNIHRISLEQDLEDARNGLDLPDDEYFESDHYYEGAIHTCMHILRMINE
jgi:hypothetical protein